MPKPAYVLLGATGIVERSHNIDFSHAGLLQDSPARPTANHEDLEKLITAGYQPVRETPLEGGKVLLLLNKP